MTFNKTMLCSLIFVLSNPVFALTFPYASYATTTVDEICELNTVDLHFGELDFIKKSGTFRVGGYVNIRCTQGTSYKLSVETINKSTGTRYLISAATPDKIEYNFYKKGTNQLFGDSGNNDYLEGVGSGIFDRVDFDAKIDSNQNIIPGNYRDTVTISVHY